MSERNPNKGEDEPNAAEGPRADTASVVAEASSEPAPASPGTDAEEGDTPMAAAAIDVATPEAEPPRLRGGEEPVAGLAPTAGNEAPADSVPLDAVMRVESGVRQATATVPAADSEPERAADPQLVAVIEALIFASPEPLTPKMLFKLLENEPKEDVELAVSSLRKDYERHGGVQIVEVAGGYQIVTRPEMHEWVRRLFHERKTQKLSVQALETLAVIAYKQPITAPEIAEIRGVNTAGVLSTLLERHLIKIAGRKAVVGRPFLYATTREVLIRFGLRDLGDLPKVEVLADVLGFEPPAGLADSGPSEGRLPLDVEPENAPPDDGDGNGSGRQIH